MTKIEKIVYLTNFFPIFFGFFTLTPPFFPPFRPFLREEGGGKDGETALMRERIPTGAAPPRTAALRDGGDTARADRN